MARNHGSPKHGSPVETRSESLAGYFVWGVAAAIALFSARDYAGGWNDGSRLATVESLVDYHTLAIDESIFVAVPRIDPGSEAPFPYPLNDPNAWLNGTQDKVLVRGRYYSHKPPIPAVLMAGEYFVWQKLTGLTARERCDEFCYWMTLGSAGVGYVAAVVSPFYLAGLLGLPLVRRLELAGSLALASMALPYARHVNDHIMLLGVASCLVYALVRLSKAFGATDSEPQGQAPPKTPWLGVAAAGCLAGLGYTIDQATGPALLLAATAIVAYRSRLRWSALIGFGLAAAPWIAAHHAINYAIGGTLTPIGSVPEYFDWPGTPFDKQNLTGAWNHPSFGAFLGYAAGLLVAPAWGFLWHNLPLLLTLPGALTILRRRPAEWPEAAALAAWFAATWLLYGALSVNLSGTCLSIRWFVPLLAAGYFGLAVLVRDEPRYRVGFVGLSLLGGGLGAIMWTTGPWIEPASPYFGLLKALGALGWVAWLAWAAWPRRKPPPEERQRTRAKNRANRPR